MKIRDLDELRVFAQIVEAGSLSAAAKTLKLPTTTVSRRLAMLEDRLGTKLIYRSTRTMSVSEAGRVLLGTARSVLAQVAEAEVALERDVDGLAGLLRIGVLSILSEDLLEVIAPLLQANPALRLELQVADRHQNPIAAGLDVAFYGGALDDSSLVARKLLDIELQMAATESYLERAGEPRTPEDLVGHNVISFGTAQPSWTLIDEHGGQTAVQLDERISSNDGRTVRDALIAGLGIGVASSRVIGRHAHVRRVLPAYRLAKIPLYAVYPAAMKRSARVEAVVSYLREALIAAGASAT